MASREDFCGTWCGFYIHVCVLFASIFTCRSRWMNIILPIWWVFSKGFIVCYKVDQFLVVRDKRSPVSKTVLSCLPRLSVSAGFDMSCSFKVQANIQMKVINSITCSLGPFVGTLELKHKGCQLQSMVLRLASTLYPDKQKTLTAVIILA